MHLGTREVSDGLNTGIKRENPPLDWCFVDIRGDVRHQSQVLDETTSFTFWCIRRTQHTPLGRLKGSRARHFAGLLELTADSGHHAEGTDVAKAAEHVRDAGSVHVEAFDAPVSGLDGPVDSEPDIVGVIADHVDGIKGNRSIVLLQELVDGHLDLAHEALEFDVLDRLDGFP